MTPFVIRSKFPGKYFISHSYGDAPVRDKLINSLPLGMKPFVFPPITTRPDEFVSNHLIKAIRSCDGLIYLQGGNSEKSFWVAFERDYALRAGLPVFAADPNTLEIKRDTSRPLDLAAFASYSDNDKKRVLKIVGYLQSERNFDVWVPSENIRPGDDWKNRIDDGMARQIKRGGYQIVFWSKNSAASKAVRDEIKQAMINASDSVHTRTIFAILEDYPLPGNLRGYHEAPVQLYSDKVRPETHRLDDLIVRLYWLIYRNTVNKEQQRI